MPLSANPSVTVHLKIVNSFAKNPQLSSKIMFNVHVEELTVLNAKSNHINQQLVFKYKSGAKLPINKKIINFGSKNTPENVQLVNNQCKNMSVVIM